MTDMPRFGEICWNELATNDVQEAKDFYKKSFGWDYTDHDLGDTIYTMVKLNGKDIGGIWPIPKDKQQQITPHWMAYILVEDIEQAVEKVRQNGAKILKPPTKASNFGIFAIIADPTGAHIALWQTLKQA
jgi:predicted enzyme related to lactoylglutathione lyase